MVGSARATSLAALAVLVGAAACVWQPLSAVVIVALVIGVAAAVRGQLGFALAFMGVLTCACSGINVGSTLTLPDIFLIPALVFAIVRAINVRNSFTPPWWAVFPAVGILAWGLIGSLIVHPETVRYLLQFSGFMFLVPMVVGLYADSPSRFRWLAIAYLGSASISAFLGVLDYTGISHIASQITNYGGLQFNHRATGLTNYSTQLGMMSDQALPFAFWLARKNRAWLLTVPVLLGGVLASGARGALIGVALAITLYIFVVGRNIVKRLLMEFAGLVTVLVLALVSGLSVGILRLFTDPATASVSDDARLEKLSFALYQFSTAPITGVGFGSTRAHNLFAELARSGGLVILFLFLAFVIGSSVNGIRLRLKYPDVTAALCGQLTWFLLAWQYNGLFERFLYVPTGLVLGIAFQAARGVASTTDDAKPVVRRRTTSAPSRPALRAPGHAAAPERKLEPVG